MVADVVIENKSDKFWGPAPGAAVGAEPGFIFGPKKPFVLQCSTQDKLNDGF